MAAFPLSRRQLIAALSTAAPRLLTAQPRPLSIAATVDFQAAGAWIAQQLKTSNLNVEFIYGASGELARKIQQGAVIDGFISSDDKYVRDLIRGRKADVRSARVFAQGRVALYSKKPHGQTLLTLREPDIARVAIPDPDVEPFGQATKQILYNKEIYTAVKGKLLTVASTKAAEQAVDSGRADAAFTSWPNVRDKDGTLIDFALHRPLRFTLVALEASPNAGAYDILMRFLFQPATQAHLQDLGFDPPSTSGSPFGIKP